jgi:hypothetical protein
MQQFMELEPVAELEEDPGAGEDSPMSSGSPSPSPQPYSGDMWAEVSIYMNNRILLYDCVKRMTEYVTEMTLHGRMF